MAGAGLTLLLRNCTVYDGTGSPPFRAQVGVAGERIAWVGPGNAGEAERVLDLDGLALTPGFIDVHSHSDFTLLADPRGEGKVLQGVTTEINGNCGLSGGPLLGEARAQREGDLEEYGITQRWEALAEYLDLLEKAAPALNVATLVGQGNIRASVMGFVRREPRPAEMEAMKALLAQCLREGALGLSTGLIYPPGAFTGTGELIALSAAGAEFPGFLYATHMRSEGERLLPACRLHRRGRARDGGPLPLPRGLHGPGRGPSLLVLRRRQRGGAAPSPGPLTEGKNQGRDAGRKLGPGGDKQRGDREEPLDAGQEYRRGGPHARPRAPGVRPHASP
ncbi:MAG: amidohydrolase family protein [Nitrospirota bacterium]